MSNFWNKHLPQGRPALPQPVAQPQQQAYAPQPAQQPGVPGQMIDPVTQQHLATLPNSQQANLQEANQIWANGYHSRPPSWVRKQPTETCPECNKPTYAAINSTEYGEGNVTIGGGTNNNGHAVPMQTFQYKRCFMCGYSSTGVHRYQQGQGNGGRTATSRQTGTGGANLQNFGEIIIES